MPSLGQVSRACPQSLFEVDARASSGLTPLTGHGRRSRAWSGARAGSTSPRPATTAYPGKRDRPPRLAEGRLGLGGWGGLLCGSISCPNGGWAWVTGRDGLCVWCASLRRIWSAQGESIHTLVGHTGAVFALRWNPTVRAQGHRSPHQKPQKGELFSEPRRHEHHREHSGC
jgi:hypothetical protein